MDWRHLDLSIELTKPQEETVKLLASSLSYKQIAEKRGINYRSVQDMLMRLYRKTGARDRFELAVWAYKTGLVNDSI